jgi:hypothetical protein
LSKLLKDREKSYFSDLRQCARKIPKTVLETKLITKKTRYFFLFGKYVVVYIFGVTQLGHFQWFWNTP